MGSFGERMQREREMRGVTLEEIAESTKIGTRSLRALEEEDFDKLPGGIFNKGFVRAYAKYLGIDEEQAVTDFLAAMGEHQAQLPAAEPQPATPEPQAPSLNLLVTGGAVALLILLLAVWKFHEPIVTAAQGVVHKAKGNARPPEPAAVAAKPQPSPTNPAPDVAASMPATDSKPPAADPKATPKLEAAAGPLLPPAGKSPAETTATPGEFVVRIRARQGAWVSITADDQLLMEGTLIGDKTVRAKSRVVFRTGNAGAVEVSFNGQLQPALGADNQVKTVVFTADGMQR